MLEVNTLVSEIESLISPLFETSMISYQRSSAISSVDFAKINVLIAYAIDTLYYVNLRVQGRFSPDHPIVKELEHLRSYMNKIRDFTQKKAQPKLKIDIDAAKRFIENEITPMVTEDAA
eukprot:TRINITY_DN6342_c0_g1_i1.p1 TRINITY_DN6342_c0_g1~~TRINITY_DN6342_c0_g1_i1.p1  ORF type:complete len:132 (-),score=58.27 TRINITY_DN6342_c0_g1_i1:103-459(-)